MPNTPFTSTARIRFALDALHTSRSIRFAVARIATRTPPCR